MKQIMIVKPKTISPKDKEKLSKNGTIVIEHPFPGDVRIIHESDGIDGNMILMSAMKAISANFPKDEFHKELLMRLQESEQKEKQK